MTQLRIARQRGWVGLVMVLVALVIVAVLAKDALKKYGLMPGAAAPIKAGSPGERARSPGAIGAEALDANSSTGAPGGAALDRARGLEDWRASERVKAPNLKLARIIGIHLEGPFLNPSRCGALDAKTFIEPTEKSLRKLLEGFEDIVKIITIAPEVKGALQLIKKISDRGIIVSMGHSDATFSEAEAGFKAGANGITHIFNAMRSFHHREPGLAGFGLINKDIYIEVITDPFHLHPKTLELIFKTKNHEKIIIVSDSVKETASPVPHPSRKSASARISSTSSTPTWDSNGRSQSRRR